MLGFLAQISVDYSRGWIVLFYFTTLAALIVLRFRHRAHHRAGARRRPDFRRSGSA